MQLATKQRDSREHRPIVETCAERGRSSSCVSTSDQALVFVVGVVVDLDVVEAAAVESILAVFSDAGNPVVVAGLDVEVVAFEAASFEALEGLSVVVECLSGSCSGR